MLDPDFHSQLLAAAPDNFWRGYLLPFTKGERPSYGLHLTVLQESYLARVLAGTKTVESRFSMTGIPPFGWVGSGDVLLLKESGGPVVALAQAAGVWATELTQDAWDTIERDYLPAIQVEPDYLRRKRATARYATLMPFDHVMRVGQTFTYRRMFGSGWQVIVPAAGDR